jgi:hypothetical protein
MNSVDHEQTAIGVCASAIGARDHLGDLHDRKLDACRRLDPGDTYGARRRCDRPADALDDLVRARRGGRIEQCDVAHAAPRACRGISDRLMVGIVVMLGRDDLLIAPDPQAVIHHRQRGGRVGGQRDLGGTATGVVGQRPLDCDERTALAVGECRRLDPHRIAVELRAEMTDGLGDRLRMRHEQETGEVRPIGREREELAHRNPVHRVGRGPQRSEPVGARFCDQRRRKH